STVRSTTRYWTCSPTPPSVPRTTTARPFRHATSDADTSLAWSCSPGNGVIHKMRVEFDGGTLQLREASEDVPDAEWDDRVEDYRAPAYRYRPLLEWADAWDNENSTSAVQEPARQETIQSATVAVEDTARAYPQLALDPALQIEPREYQQAALDAWRTHDRRGSVVLPTGSGKTFLGIQAIADAGVGTLVVAPTIDLMNQRHATLANALGDQLPPRSGDGPEHAVGVLGGGTHEIRPITVTTY